MKKIFILGLMALLCHLASAQHKLSGSVITGNSQPLLGVTIYIQEINKGTISDANGYYQLNNLPEGELKVQFSFIGFTNSIETVDMAKGDVILDVKLNQTSIETEEIVVSGGFNTTQHENAVKIENLRLDPLEVKSTPNFAEMLTRIPGVDMISKGSGVSKPVIRGLSMNDILVLSNGVRFENYQYSSHHPLGIDEFGIGNVEVIKGPASLLYGSDAIGGVINFIKEKPAPVGSLEGDYNLQLFSNTLGLTNNIGMKASPGNFFGGIRAGQKSNADFVQGGGEYVPNSRFNEHSVKANVGYAGSIGLFSVFYDYNKQNLGLVEEEAVEEISERGRLCEIFYQQLNTHLLTAQNKLYIGKIKLDVDAGYQNTELIHFGEKDAFELQMKLATLTYESKLYLPSDKNSEYIIGFQGMNQRNSNLNDRETILLPNATTRNISGFGLFQRTFFSKFKTQAGIRYDLKSIVSDAVGLSGEQSYRAPLNKQFGSFSGSVGATCNVSDELLFRGNIASAFRTPNLAELTSIGPHETRYELGDEDLVPENSLEFDLSLHFHKSNVTFDAAGFYNSINNYIFISPTNSLSASGLPVYMYKQSNSFLYGGEAGLHVHPETIKWLHLVATYSAVVGKQTDGSYLPFVPANKLNFEIRASKDDFFFLNNAFVVVNSTTAFKQNHIATDETVTDGYSLFDLSIGGELKFYKRYVSLSVSATNILDKRYIDHLSTLKEVGLLNPGRNIAFTLKVPFGSVK